MCIACCDCSSEIIRSPSGRGRIPKRCDQCKAAHIAKAERLRKRHQVKRHRLVCQNCGGDFDTCRPRQKYCSPQCRQLASRQRQRICCQECGMDFDCVAGRAEARKFCSMDCWLKAHAVPTCQCHNCGKDFPRKSYTHPWQGKNKFCSRECAWDHRWGADRPRKGGTASAKKTWAQRSRTTTIKHRCEHYGCPFDPACTREAVCERDGWVCQKCGVQCHKGECRMIPGTRRPDPRNAEHDHIWPLSMPDGPGNVMSNSQCLCRTCNGRKRAKGGSQLRLAYAR